ncbi:MAG: lipid-A-disaccharide synthase [Armatimonadetes bacterium]|nr:lipid-A-disaccharide synthase [Candidatus Hippobium faecium]
MKKFRIAVSCGESSGDLNAGYLIETLKKKYEGLEFYGIGGKHLREAGCDLLFETEKFGTIGVVQAVKVFFRLLSVYKKFKKKLIEDKPDLLLCVDFGFFNSKLIKAAAKAGIKNIYYFPPASWKKNLRHADSLVEAKSKVITPFPWSETILKGFGLEAVFLGHPLLDIAKADKTKEEFYRDSSLPENAKILGFLPGSRKFEINMHTEPFADTINRLFDENCNYYFLVASSKTYKDMTEEKLKNLCPQAFGNIRIISDEAYNIMTYSEFLFCCSGTATLEASIIGTPMVILYRGTKIMQLEYLIRKKGLPTIIGMPNIILERYAVPELISENVNSGNMIEAYRKSLENTDQIKNDFTKIKEILGTPPVIDKIAETFAEMAGIEKTEN